MVLLDQSSPSGVYDLAVEASAEKIMLAARESNSSSGYASDADTLESQETSSGDLVSYLASASSSVRSVSDVSEDESIESEIAFLRQKQNLLERAMTAMKREETYDASKARDVVNGNLPEEAAIWKEAKDVLDALKNTDGDGRASTRKATLSTIPKRKSAKRPRIDVSSVLCKSSTDADNQPAITTSFDRLIPNKHALGAGHWVAQAMAQAMDSSAVSASSSLVSGTNCTWEVMNDPDLGPLVVPPSKLRFKNELQLKDALSFTPNAQFITLSTPPFFVVHANKAFSMFSGLQNADVVGKPVDAVIQVMNHQSQLPPLAPSSARTTSPSAFRCEVVGSRKSCQVHLTPISDKYRKTQRWISHLLMQVEHQVTRQEQAESSGFEIVELVQKTPPSSPSPVRPYGFGTVG